MDKLEADVVEKEQTIDSLKQCCRDAEEREESLKYMRSSVHVHVYMHMRTYIMFVHMKNYLIGCKQAIA